MRPAWLSIVIAIIVALLSGSFKREEKRRPRTASPATPSPATPDEAQTHPPERVPESRLRSDLAYEGPGHADEGVDPCHDGMSVQPKRIERPTPAIPGIRLNFSADELVKGVLYAEILARPGSRRR